MKGFWGPKVKPNETLALSCRERALRGAKRGLRYWLFIAGPVAAWCVLQSFGAFSEDLASGVTMILVTLLFIASLPTAIIVRLDITRTELAIDSHLVLLGLAALTALVNLTACGALLGMLRGVGKRAPQIQEAPHTEASPKGTSNSGKQPKR